MTLPINFSHEYFTTVARDQVLSTYQAMTLATLFQSVAIPNGIAAEDWAQRYIKEQKRAALTARGYNPNTITMDMDGFKVKPVTISQETLMGEIDRAQFEINGLLPQFIPEMGKNLAYTMNTYIMLHKGGNAETGPHSTYHYLLAEGSGNGTADRPNWISDANTAGGWGTWANIQTDIATLKGTFMAKAPIGSFGQLVCLAPKCAAPTLIRNRSEYQNKSVEQYIQDQGMALLYIEDEFFTTQAGALPTAILFDLVVINPMDFIIGYQRAESINVIPPYADVRTTKIEAEVWPCFLCVPFRKNESGTMKTYKSATRVRAIAP